MLSSLSGFAQILSIVVPALKGWLLSLAIKIYCAKELEFSKQTTNVRPAATKFEVSYD